MNYFTLDLYRRFNSQDLDEAVRADAEWEEAIDTYKRSLEGYRDELPPGAKKLAEGQNLHDAEILGIRFNYLANYSSFWFVGAANPTPFNGPFNMVSQMAPHLVIALAKDGQNKFILYSLWMPDSDRRLTCPRAGKPLRWLYDEILPEPNLPRHFWHNVLLSDETTIRIPFVDCLYFEFDARGEEKPLVQEVSGI